MFGLLVYLASGAWLWICFITITKIYRYNWWEFVIWGGIARLLSEPLIIMSADSPIPLVHWGGRIAGILCGYVFLYIILSTRFSLKSVKTKLAILAMHLSVNLIITIIIS